MFFPAHVWSNSTLLNSSLGPRQNPCCNIQQRLHGQGPRIVLLACESMRSYHGGRKAVSNPFFPLNIYSISLLKQVEHANATVKIESSLAFTACNRLQSINSRAFWDLKHPPAFNLMMASSPVPTSATEAEQMNNADVWLLIHGDDPQDKQFSVL